VRVNNQHIERDDLQNYLLGSYPAELKAEKKYHRIFYHSSIVVVHTKKE